MIEPEVPVYDNTGVEYGEGIFSIDIVPQEVRYVKLTRPTGDIMTICEVQVYGGNVTNSNGNVRLRHLGSFW